VHAYAYNEVLFTIHGRQLDIQLVPDGYRWRGAAAAAAAAVLYLESDNWLI